MQGKVNCLWGPQETLGNNTDSPSLGFEDSFSPQDNQQQQQQQHQQQDTTRAATHTHANGESYVPLEDSQQYLAGLESKLARVQGRTASSRQTESRRLLDALSGSRSCHTAQLMQDNDASHADFPAMEPPTSSSSSSSSSTVDPQGALGAMLRKMAPDRVALTPEELCHLLQSDLLAQMHECHSATPTPATPAAGDNTTPHDKAADSVEAKESSDEGEK